MKIRKLTEEMKRECDERLKEELKAIREEMTRRREGRESKHGE